MRILKDGIWRTLDLAEAYLTEQALDHRTMTSSNRDFKLHVTSTVSRDTRIRYTEDMRWWVSLNKVSILKPERPALLTVL